MRDLVQCRKVKKLTIANYKKESFDLKVLKYFTNLKELSVTTSSGKYTKIKNLKTMYQYNTKLERVTFKHCKLKRVFAPKKLNQLRNLSVSDCQLKRIQVDKNNNLETLDCMSNSIKSLDLSKNKHLYSLAVNSIPQVKKSTLKLYMNGKNIRTINSSNTNGCTLIDLRAFDFQNLKTFTCNRCLYEKEKKEIFFGDVPKLDNINITGASVKKLEFLSAPKLKNIIADYNYLMVLNTDRLPKLELLHVKSNQLLLIDLSKNNKVNFLSCSSNAASLNVILTKLPLRFIYDKEYCKVTILAE